MLSASVVHNYLYITCFLGDIYRSSEGDNGFSNENRSRAILFLLAARFADKATAKQLKAGIDLLEYNTIGMVELPYPLPDVPGFGITPLHVAAQLGKYELVEYFIASENLFLTKPPRYLLHTCVSGSTTDSSIMVRQKSQIIKILAVHHRNGMIDETFPVDLSTPIIQPNVHLTLIRCLHKEGANINLVTKQGENVLHRFVRPLITRNVSNTPAEYHELVTFLKELSFEGFQQQNQDGKTPLHSALEAIDIQSNTVDAFIYLGVNFATVDKNGETPLVYAIRFGRSEEIIEKLMSLTDGYESMRNSSGESLLHIAARHGNLLAVKRVLEAILNTFPIDNAGNNPLHSALSSRSKAYTEIQTLLLESGVSPNDVNHEGMSPIMFGFKKGKGVTLPMVKLMENHGLIWDSSLASQALKYLLANERLRLKNWDLELMASAEYLQSLCPVTKSKNTPNLWTLNQVKLNEELIIESIQLTTKLLNKVESFVGLSPFDRVKASESVKDLIQVLQDKANSFERLMLSLILDSQQKPFDIMKQCLQLEQTSNTKFVHPPQGLREGLGSDELQIIMLHSHDVGLTIERLRDTVGQAAQYINDKTFLKWTNTNIGDETLVVVTLSRDKNQESVVSKFESLYSSEADQKLICVLTLNELVVHDKKSNVLTLVDRISWSDLSSSFQEKLVSCFLFNKSSLLRSAAFGVCSLYSHHELLLLIQVVLKVGTGLRFNLCGNGNVASILKLQLKQGSVFQEIAEWTELTRMLPRSKYIIVEDVPRLATAWNLNSAALSGIELVEQNLAYHEFQALSQMSAYSPCFTLYAFGIHLQTGTPQQYRPGFYTELLESFCLTTNHHLQCPSTLRSISDPRQPGWSLQLHFEHVHECILQKICVDLHSFDEAEVALFLYGLQLTFPAWANIFQGFTSKLFSKGGQLISTVAMIWRRENFDFVPSQQLLYEVARLLTNQFPKLIEEKTLGNFVQEVLLETIPTSPRFRANLDIFVFKDCILVYFVDIILQRKFLESAEDYCFRRLLNQIRIGEAELGNIISACIVGNYFEVLKAVLDIEPSVVRIGPQLVESVVTCAVLFGTLPILQLVLDKFKPIIEESKSCDLSDALAQMKLELKHRSLSLLQVALFRGHRPIFKYLLSFIEINRKYHDDNCSTLLHSVFYEEPAHNLVGSVQILLDNNVDVTVADDEGLTPLHYAVRFGTSPNLFIAIALLILSGCDVNAKDKSWHTMLHLAPRFRTPKEYHRLVRLLAENGFEECLDLRDNDGRTPLHHAVRHLEILEETLGLLISHTSINAEDNDKNSVLFHAIQGQRSQTFLELMIENGADWKSARNQSGNTVLHHAVFHDNVAAVKMFIALGCDVNARSLRCFTPLNYVGLGTGENDEEITEILVSHGAEY